MTIRYPHAGQQAPVGAQHNRIAAGFMHQTVGHPTRGAATGLQRRAVGVPELDARSGVFAVEHHGQLIEANAGVAIAQATGDLGGDRVVQATAVDDDEVVAVGVHLCERQGHGLSWGRPVGELEDTLNRPKLIESQACLSSSAACPAPAKPRLPASWRARPVRFTCASM
ncbi:hypothetical protein EMIT0357P_60372 [Pseudomonas marginalis]